MTFERRDVEGAVAIVFEDSLAGVIIIDLDDRLGAFEDVEAECVRVESGVENLQKEGVELVVFNIPRDCRVEVTGPGRIRDRYVVVLVPDRDIRWLEDFEFLQVKSQHVLMDDGLNGNRLLRGGMVVVVHHIPGVEITSDDTVLHCGRGLLYGLHGPLSAPEDTLGG